MLHHEIVQGQLPLHAADVTYTANTIRYKVKSRAAVCQVHEGVPDGCDRDGGGDGRGDRCDDGRGDVSGPMIQEQALQFAERLERPDLKESCGWLNSFKSSHNLTGATLSGEKGSANADIVDQWLQRVPGYGVHSLPKLHSPTYYPIMRY